MPSIDGYIMKIFYSIWTNMSTISPLKVPFTMLVAASSNSGKTHLVRDMIINHYRLFERPIDEIVWLYHPRAFDEELMQQLKRDLNVPIRFIEGFPSKAIEEGSLFNADNKAVKLLVVDDLVATALRTPIFLELHTIMSHHNNICVVGIMQNLHADTPSQRQMINNIIRNLSYIVLFPDRRNLGALKQIARTYFNGEEYKLVQPFKQLIDSKEKYNYMLIDFIDLDLPVKFNTLRTTDKPYYFKFELTK